ncbi:MAG: hypothetical protein CSA61_00025 [Neptuniibacter caesariensis]|uniref:Copper chaperone PCu(A)C n=1 Tax=Neptuniibacter caesariensis TaxID=207954 RepID=A0A2G6JBW8_NEPCE|nr:MAG: hypothetical protein CSA61_00025 [Neptuniibacter caesariensis]
MKTYLKTFILFLVTLLSVNAYAEITVLSSSVKASSDGDEGQISIRLRNDDRYDVYLTSAHSPATAKVIFESLETVDGVEMMVEQDRLLLPGEQIVTLAGDQHRLLLVEPKRPLSKGSTIDLSLSLSNGKTLNIDVPVIE